MTTRAIHGVLGSLLLAATPYPQTSRGTIAGTVIDASGGVGPALRVES